MSNPGTKIGGVLFIALGIYFLLQGYGKVPPYKKMDPEKSKLWLQRYGREIKIIGLFQVLLGLGMLFGVVN